MLSNAYSLAKFGSDTAENEPAKNLQNFTKLNILESVANLKSNFANFDTSMKPQPNGPIEQKAQRHRADPVLGDEEEVLAWKGRGASVPKGGELRK